MPDAPAAPEPLDAILPTPRPATVLVLRTCAGDLTSHSGGFRWPESGPVAAPDWSADPHCGHGLHGFLWGEGDGGLADWSADARWLVVEVEADTIVDLKGKVKFPKGTVLYCGDRAGATTFLAERSANRAIVGGTATAGDDGTATAGYRGTATAGHRGTATAGHRGTATAGHRGTATAGDDGTATAGDDGTATAGHRGTLIVRWWDDSADRVRSAVGYIGEAGLEPGVPYRWIDGKFVEARP